MFWIFRWFWWGSGSRSIETFGGIFRRLSNLSRVFRRQSNSTSRTYRRISNLTRVFRNTIIMAKILTTTLAKASDETVTYLFDFSNFPEVLNGETISSPSVTGSGLTIGTPSIITSKLDGIPANQGIKVQISGGTVGYSYNLECKVNCSGGDIRAVKGILVVE